MGLQAEAVSGECGNTNGVPIDIGFDYLDEISVVQRWCSKCRTFKPWDEFYRDITRAGGKEYVCKKCSIAKTLECRRNSKLANGRQ